MGLRVRLIQIIVIQTNDNICGNLDQNCGKKMTIIQIYFNI